MRTIYLPQKKGYYKDVPIPQYLDRVLFKRTYGNEYIRIKDLGNYWYIIYGWDKIRPAYGIEKDIELLKRFLDRFAKFEDGTSLQTITDIKFHKKRKNYWVKFKMVDPYAWAMEQAGLVDMKNRW